MTRRPKIDARQTDFFGAPTSKAASPDLHDAPKNKASQKSKLARPLPGDEGRLERDSLNVLAARLSPAELNELVGALPDVSLGHLVIVAARQLRHRLARNNWNAGKRRGSSPLERAVRQLIAELGEQGGDDDM